MSYDFAIYVLQPNVFSEMLTIVRLVQHRSALSTSGREALHVSSEFIGAET